MVSHEMLRALAGPETGVGVAQVPGDQAIHHQPDGARNFALGRLAAGRALAELGVEVSPLPVGAGGAPVWPDGIVGSIAHAGGVGVAVAARSRDLKAVGVDLERAAREVSEAVGRRVCTASELEWVRSSGDTTLHTLIVFCAKEAIYKALSHVGGPVRFRDVELTPAGARTLVGAIRLSPRPSDVPAAVKVRYRVEEGFVVACVRIPH